MIVGDCIFRSDAANNPFNTTLFEAAQLRQLAAARLGWMGGERSKTSINYLEEGLKCEMLQSGSFVQGTLKIVIAFEPVEPDPGKEELSPA